MSAEPRLVAGEARVACFQEHGPWTAPGTLYYWRGPFSSFAALPAGCRFAVSWCGRAPGAATVAAATVEHWFQAAKATNAEDFAWILEAPTARQAKQRGGPRGEGGRQIALRGDWEAVKFAVMCAAQRVKFAREPYRTLLLATGARPLAELSPYDPEWGCYDRHAGTHTGHNLHGRALMRVRSELVGDAITAARQLTGADAPFATASPAPER